MSDFQHGPLTVLQRKEGKHTWFVIGAGDHYVRILIDGTGEVFVYRGDTKTPNLPAELLAEYRKNHHEE